MRALLFTDANTAATVALVERTLRLTEERADLDICGIVTVRPEAFAESWRSSLQRYARAGVVAAANREMRFSDARPRRLSMARLRRRHGASLLVPPDRDANGRQFREQVVRELRPDVALTYYAGTIFRAPLLECFEQVVNYHDALLPAYRGVGATALSIYHGEASSGFTFHRMVEQIDAGPILVQGAVPVDEQSRVGDVERGKIVAAVAALPRVLERMAAGDAGESQTGPSSYFSRRDVDALRIVDRPQDHTADELALRIRAFGTVSVRIAGRRYAITRLRAVTSPVQLSFRSADGRLLAPARIRDLPRSVHSLSRRLRRRRP